VARAILVILVILGTQVTVQVAVQEGLMQVLLERRGALAGLAMQIVVMLEAAEVRAVVEMLEQHQPDLALTFRAEPEGMVEMLDPLEMQAEEAVMAETLAQQIARPEVQGEGVRVAEVAVQIQPIIVFNLPVAVAQGFVTPEIRLLPVHPVATVRKVTPEGGKEDKGQTAVALQTIVCLVRGVNEEI
jgi:hypothetical protein